MSNSSEKKLVLVAAWSFVLLALVLVSQQTLQADDTKSSDPPGNMCQLRVELRGKIPLLEKIPLVKYFTTKSNAGTECVVAQEGAERIGVDFDLLPGHMVAYLPNGERQVICMEKDCPACETTNVCAAAKSESLENNCCTKGPCEGCQEVDAAVAGHAAQLTLECSELQELCHADQANLCQELLELRVENASLHAVREAQASTLEARCKMFEHVLELATANARLEAEVEFLHKQHDLREELFSLQSQNERLKTAVQVAEERHTMQKHSMEIALENERLKLRLAELEQRGSPSQKVARTAKKPRASKKDAELK